jgi:MoaA/NifB/PqqE/SkfB family radical SAM enzyme
MPQTIPSHVFDGRVPFPQFASIETTMKCNLECPMCLPFLAGSTVLGRHMEGEDFEEIARALFPFVDTFQLTISGEPLMSKGLARMLELAEEYGVRTEYYTNGTLLSDRMIAAILPTLGQICISFDGATKETFDELRKGATFEQVLANVERLAAEIAKVPESRRPVAGFAVTVMERNVRELPALVELAHRLRLDFVSIAHVLPAIDEFRRQSLVHHVDLAKRWIDEALARGLALGIPVVVAPLDQVTVAMAETGRPDGVAERPLAIRDGAVEGLGERAVLESASRPRPPAPVVTPAARRHVAERPSLRRRAAALPAPAATPAMPDSVWFCDYLWNRTYVTAESTVRPCCMPNVPDLGDLRESSFESVWDNEALRAMRIGLVRKEPAPLCRGCQGIREVTDPAAIERILQGRALPPAVPLPPVLVPLVDDGSAPADGSATRPRAAGAAPVVTWPAVPEAAGYEFEASSEGGTKGLRFHTRDRARGLSEPRIAIPAWIWEKAPLGAPVSWRAIAKLPGRRAVVARGWLVRVEPGTLPLTGEDAVPPSAPVVAVAPPEVRWAQVQDAAGYAFEGSLDAFAHTHFSTLSGTRVLTEPHFAVPASLWQQVPPGDLCHWRALAIHPDRREVVARGCFERRSR